MIDVKTLYSEKDYMWDGHYSDLWDYQPMINAFGTVILQVEDDDYQGDTRVLYEKDGKIGHLIFGWGSCSGCDALQGCNSIEEVQELCDSLENDIKWFDTKEEALQWFETHDWKGNYYWYMPETHEYIEKAIKYLKGEKIDA